MTLLHISDIHPNEGDDLRSMAASIAQAVQLVSLPQYIVVSGDVGLKGNQQQRGVEFITLIAASLKVDPTHVVFVPGNHDIEIGNNSRPFDRYAKAVYTFTRSSALANPVPAQWVKSGDCSFLLVNSSYRLDPNQGQVDCQAVAKSISQSVKGEYSICVVHHNSIPVSAADKSTIVNAYEFLKLVSDAGYDAILHGHQHIAISLKIRETKLIGVGSVNYPPEINVNNQFNVIEIGRRVFRFRYLRDSIKPGLLGNWNPEEEPW